MYMSVKIVLTASREYQTKMKIDIVIFLYNGSSIFLFLISIMFTNIIKLLNRHSDISILEGQSFFVNDFYLLSFKSFFRQYDINLFKPSQFLLIISRL